MESTGIYHQSIVYELIDAGLFVSVVNPLKMKRYCQSDAFRKVKTDKADAKMIARYGTSN